MTIAKRSLIALFALLTLPMAANAAFISIDDSDVDTITITVNDFEGCFFVNGELLSCGLGDPQSITLVDGEVHEYSASWIDLGLSADGFNAHYFGIMDEVFSGVEYSTSTDGFFGRFRWIRSAR